MNNNFHITRFAAACLRLQRTLCALVLLLVVWMPRAEAKPLVSDISDSLIYISTEFKGTDILLFGARNEAGEIVVVVRGPKQTYTVRRMKRMMGIWANRSEVTFPDTDSFYAMASSRPLRELKSDYLLRTLGIGLDNMPFTTKEEPAPNVHVVDYRNALLEDKKYRRLYNNTVQFIPFMAETLFKVVIHFPDTIPSGHYVAETYLINNGQLLGVHYTPISVEKIGFDAFIYNLAHKQPALYGIAAISLALCAGWIASQLFKRT